MNVVFLFSLVAVLSVALAIVAVQEYRRSLLQKILYSGVPLSEVRPYLWDSWLTVTLSRTKFESRALADVYKLLDSGRSLTPEDRATIEMNFAHALMDMRDCEIQARDLAGLTVRCNWFGSGHHWMRGFYNQCVLAAGEELDRRTCRATLFGYESDGPFYSYFTTRSSK